MPYLRSLGLKRGLIFSLLALGLAATALVLGPARGADHRDSPGAEADNAADITDVYAFRSPAAPDNLVVAFGVNGLTAPADNLSANFSNDVTYTIHVDTNADLADDATVNINFAGSGDAQTYTVTGLPGGAITGDVTPPSTDPVAPAPKINEQGGIKTFAGQRDDAFFFDLTCFKKFVAAPYVPTSGYCQSPDAPADTFRGTNVSYIVIEFPIAALTGDPNSGAIKAWTSTTRAGQVDRMAIPAINTALIPSASKDAFNQGAPATDTANWNATATTTMDGLRAAVDAAFGAPQDGGPLGDLTSQQVADALIPDIVTVDFANPVAFPNGRRLQDDVIDAAVGIVLNRGGAAGLSDAIDANDKAFSDTFPYLAEPHQPPAQAATATPTTTGPTAAPTPTTQLPAAAPASGGLQGGETNNGWLVILAITGAALVLAGATAVALKRRAAR